MGLRKMIFANGRLLNVRRPAGLKGELPRPTAARRLFPRRSARQRPRTAQGQRGPWALRSAPDSDTGDDDPSQDSLVPGCTLLRILRAQGPAP